MSQQNIYDNEVFFEGYRNIRKNRGNANILIEKPALFSLLPDLRNKTILDLGCGYGENCGEFIALGAKKVTGIDISEKMLEVAQIENSDRKIEYRNISMENIHQLQDTFDVVISSLAIHYVRDFATLAKNAYNLLRNSGVFIFSQENPLNTCFTAGNRWTTNADGNAVYANISNYSVDGERKSKWYIDDVQKYHRTFSSIINALINAGFIIERLLEPVPTEEVMKSYPEYKKDIHKPDFLLVRAKK